MQTANRRRNEELQFAKIPHRCRRREEERGRREEQSNCKIIWNNLEKKNGISILYLIFILFMNFSDLY